MLSRNILLSIVESSPNRRTLKSAGVARVGYGEQTQYEYYLVAKDSRPLLDAC